MRLAPGWRLGAAGAVFVLNHERIELPAGCKVRPHIPALAAQPDAQLSTAERDLARYVQVLLPANAKKKAVRALLEKLDYVEAVTEPPAISLP